MDTIMLLAKDMPQGFWSSIIGWFGSFISSYGWTIVVFTIVLKLVLSPLDFYQRLSMRKTQRQQALLQPEMAKIQEKFGHDKNLMQQKQMELYKKNHINPASGCLPILIYMAVTLVVFITLFSSMNTISEYKINKEYQTLQQTYIENYTNYKANFESDQTAESAIKITYEGNDYNYYQLVEFAKNEFNTNKNEEGKYIIGDSTFENETDFATAFVDTTLKTVAQDKVLQKFNEIRQSWLWVKNIFRPDNQSSSFPNYAEFINQNKSMYNEKTVDGSEQKYYYKSIDENAENSTNGYYYLTDNAEENATILANAKLQGEKDYNNVTLAVQKAYSSWNGYFILVILAGALTVLGQLFGSAGSKTKNQNGEMIKVKQPVNKMMLIVMPLFMMWFTFGYTALFAIYIVTNSLVSLLIGYLINLIVNKFDAKSQTKELVKISMKDRTAKVTSRINGNSMANQDYRIQKKGDIIYEKPEKADKKSKKSAKNEKIEQNSNKNDGNEGEVK